MILAPIWIAIMFLGSVRLASQTHAHRWRSLGFRIGSIGIGFLSLGY